MSNNPVYVRRYHYDCNTIQEYQSYLEQEIKDRARRHNHILKLLNFSEDFDTTNPTVSMFYEKGPKGDDCVCIEGINPVIFYDKNHINDTLPFFRNINLPNGEMLSIKDDFYSDGNAFETKIVLYGKGSEHRMAGRKDLFISYFVSEYDEPLLLSISYDNAEVELGRRHASFKYSDYGRERSVEFCSTSDSYEDIRSATYLEETSKFSPSNQKGKITVFAHEGARSWETETCFAGGFGNDLEMSPIDDDTAAKYSQAIVSHRRAQEVIDMTLKIITEKVPTLKRFISDEFPIVEKIQKGAKARESDTIVDTVYSLISSPLLDLGEYGFNIEDEDIPTNNLISNKVLRDLKEEHGYPTRLYKYLKQSKN